MKIVVWKECRKEQQNIILSRAIAESQQSIKEKVCEIIQNVRQLGDAAVKDYTQQFDGITLQHLAVTAEEWHKSEQVAKSSQQALHTAYQNIKRFHELQLPQNIGLNTAGINLTREFRPIESVGLYIPGGTAPLVSTLLMLAIPAAIAGCKQIIVITPPNRNGSIHPAILYAAKMCGITQLYKLGGAQGIAALAYGTETIPKVMKIFGPGNKYVTAAKQQVAQQPNGAAFDMPAGPSEVFVIADRFANPSFVAADLLAQAEHDENAKAILVTIDKKLAAQVLHEVETQTAMLSRKAILTQSLKSALIILVDNMDECFNLANRYAPEHLLLQIENPQQYREKIQNAGSVFIGQWSPEALGDYASGANHVLPTYGYGFNYSGLGVESFMKAITFQEVSKRGLLNIAECVENLAALEGLDGHKNSVTIRRKSCGEIL